MIRKESKSSTFNSAARSSVWKTLWISPFWLSWTLIALFKNHVLKIFLAFFNLQHLKNKLWLPAHILSEIYKLLDFRMIFHDQKTLSLNIITSVYSQHYVSTKIFVEYPSFCFFWSVLVTEAAMRCSVKKCF